MKNYFLVLGFAFTGLFACENSVSSANKSEEIKAVVKEPTLQRISSIPFEGEWTQDFHLGDKKNSVAHVYYRIGEDSIQYEKQGPLSVKYTLKKDTFVKKDTRWLGRLHDVFYVIFIKQTSSSVLNIAMKKVKNRQEGLEIPVPDKNSKNQLSPWNAFHRTK